jgi:hypothetical protein
MVWMRAYPLRGEVGGGWALEFERFFGPVKWHRADRRVPFGAQKLENSRAQIPPTSSSNGYARIQNIMHKKPTREVSGPILWGGGGSGE